MTAYALLVLLAQLDGGEAPPDAAESLPVAPLLHRDGGEHAADAAESSPVAPPFDSDGGERARTAALPRLDGGERPGPVTPRSTAAERDGGTPLLPWRFPFVFRTEATPVFRRSGNDAEARVLIDAASAGAHGAALVHVSAFGNIDVFPHRHAGHELVVVLEGRARLRPAGQKPVDLGPKDAALLPPGSGHGWYWSGTEKKPGRFLLLYSPTGPERQFRDGPGDTGTVLLGGPELKKLPGKPPAVVPEKRTVSYPLAHPAASVRMYFDQVGPPASPIYAGLFKAPPGYDVPEHVHAAETEILYVTSGSAELVIDGQTTRASVGSAVHIPPGRRHRAKVTSAIPFEAVQFYTPSGPEQRFKTAR